MHMKARTADPAGFDLFWAAYPRKVAKGAALKAWAHLKPTPALQTQIIDALSWQVGREEWDERRFVPYPATWLNRMQWEDERPAPLKKAVGFVYTEVCFHEPRCRGREECYVRQEEWIAKRREVRL